MPSPAISILLAARRAHDAGDNAAAERLYRQALKADPANIQAARQLGALLISARRDGEAIGVLAPGAQRSDPESLLLLGRCLLATGQIDQASLALERAVSRGDRGARAWLAQCRLAQMRQPEADAIIRGLLAESPRDPQVLSVAGRAAMLGGRREEGLAHLRAARAAAPSLATHADLASALMQLGLASDALVEFDAALALDRDCTAAIVGRAAALEALGRRDESGSCLRGAADRGLNSPQLAGAFARIARSSGESARAIEVLQGALAAAGAMPVARAMLLFSLGAVREADGEYDAAFACFKEANDLHPCLEPGAYVRPLDEVIEAFTRDRLHALPRASRIDERPVFIVGMPRSGTSLVEQILACHPAVHASGELDDLPRLAHEMPRPVGSLTQQQVDRMSAAYLDRVAPGAGKAARFTDKLPHNFAYLGLIDVLFPGARVIHCVRDPLDTCVSCYTTPFAQASHSYTHRLGSLGAVFNAYRRVMEHWRSVNLRLPIHEVRYEDLVRDPATHTRRLIEFVGLPWDDRCLRPHEAPRVAHTASRDQVRRPIYGTSVGRWRRYEVHIGELIRALAPLTSSPTGSC